MPEILVIAEKPAMGRDIAEALAHMHQIDPRNIQKDGLAQKVANYTVIGAQGHLYTLSEAPAYGEQFNYPWQLDPLPVLPDQFKWEVNLEKKNGKVVDSDLTRSIRARVAKIKELITKADQVIHAGDPDREGQLIIDNVLRQMRFKGPVQRLWLHAQTKEGITEALKKMKNNNDYRNLGIAAVARAESDWAIGINSTRAYTYLWWKKDNQRLLNIWRVMTPVVGMLVKRENDIKSFVPIDHFTLKAVICISGHNPFSASWVKPTGEGQAQFDPTGKLIIDQAFVQSIADRCQGKTATIITADKTPKKEAPPLLHSLISLQKTAAKFGYSPEEVLKAAQSLYEKHKLTSYPRTECNYAPEIEHLKAKEVFQAINANFSGDHAFPAGANLTQKSKAWDDKKLAEHYAIIPLSTKLSVSNLTAVEKNVYKIICTNYLAQFFPDHEFIATSIVAQVETEKFKATGISPTKDGWKALFDAKGVAKKKSDDQEENLPNVSVGESGSNTQIELKAQKTEPPKRFTAITLLEAMEKAYLFVTDPKVKATLKEVEGLGTAATRAAIISKIVKAQFAQEEKSGKVISYAPTAKAFTYIQCVPESLAKPDLTAWFEGKLEELVAGTLDYERYRYLLAKLVDNAIASAKDGSVLNKMPQGAPRDSKTPYTKTVSKKPRKLAKKS